MENMYLKETDIMEKSEIEKKEELLDDIIQTKKKLEQARQNFEFAEGELVDYYLYMIKANQSKLNYLLKQAKIIN